MSNWLTPDGLIVLNEFSASGWLGFHHLIEVFDDADIGSNARRLRISSIISLVGLTSDCSRSALHLPLLRWKRRRRARA